jgi:hypothetical protein
MTRIDEGRARLAVVADVPAIFDQKEKKKSGMCK